MLDIVVVNYKTYDLLQKFLDTLNSNKPSLEYTTVVVDNESNAVDYGKNILRMYSSDLIVNNENEGYAKACNMGASVGRNKYIGLFNSDVEFTNPDALDICVQFMEDHPEVGVCGPKQISTREGINRITNAGIFGTNKKPKHRGWRERDQGQYSENEKCLMVMGSAMIIRREAWDKIHNDSIFRSWYPNATGAMPEHPLYYEDTFLCYIMPHFGYEVYYIGEANLVHQWHETISRHGDGGKFNKSRKMFRGILDDYGVEHD